MMEIKTFVRSLSFAQAKILLVMLVERGGLTAEELSFRTGIKDMKTLRAACKELARSEFGLLASQSGAHGRQTWIPSGLLLPLTRSAYFDEPESPPLLTQIGDFPLPDDEQFIIDDIPERGKSPLWNENQAADRGESPICAGSIRLMIDDLNSSCSDEKSDFPKLEKLLAAMSVLRGMKFQNRYNANLPWESLSITDIDPRTPAKLALAWIVKAYGDRERLSNPVGMVLMRLKSGAFRSLPENWRERLPEAYLKAIGVEPVEHPAETQVDAPAETISVDSPAQEPPTPPEQPAPEAEQKPNIFRLYEENIGPLTPMLADILRDAEKTYPESWARDAFEIAVKNNRRSWNYVQGVLKKWQEHGRDWEPSAPRARSNYGTHQQSKTPGTAGNSHGAMAAGTTGSADDDAAALAVINAQASA